jgi:FKBP-type peptidyl-prolyl cis-trans isomerase SlyD
MKIQDQAIVGIHYTLKNDAGEVLDSSDGGEALRFLQGSGGIIKGLEAALDGKEAGEKLDVTIEAEEAYGVHQEELVQEAPKEAFAGIDKIEVGMSFQAQTEHGPVPIVVTAVNEDTVTVDGNHPLAGERLHFAVSIEEVREATQQEIDHGHAH